MTVRLPDRNASWALLVGASRFDSAGLHDLPSVANNVRELDAVLTDPHSGILDRSRRRVVLDPATPQQVGDAILEATGRATDTLVIYYAGHGVLSQRGVPYLAVRETNDDPQRVSYSGVSMELLRQELADSPAANRVLILDCCFSGRAAEALSAEASAVTAALDIRGTYTLASAPANLPSVAPLGDRFTAFTGELLDVLRNGVSTGGPLLALADIFPAVTRGLLARGMPRPQHLGTGLADRIALARNAAYRPAARPPVAASTAAKVRPARAAPVSDVVPADPALAKAFHDAMLDVYRRAKRELGYSANYFLRLVSDVGGVEAARKLLHSESVSSGFTTLWEKGRLDMSAEAVVLQDRFAGLFTEEERAIARDRLEKYGYRPAQTS